MAALSKDIVIVVLLITGTALAPRGDSREDLPPNLYAQVPVSRNYYNWWRPYRIIFDTERVRRIDNRIEEALAANSTGASLDAAAAAQDIDGKVESALLFPVLATKGSSGSLLLGRLLQGYNEGRKLDDRWLLIVSALGMQGAAESELRLRQELERVAHAYAATERTVDIRLPVVDAILASRARRGVLVAGDIEEMTTMLAPSKQAELVWMMGLEWASAFSSQDRVLELLEGCFATCDEAELTTATSLADAQSPKVGVLQKYCLGPPSVWPTTVKFVLRTSERRESLKDYLLALYLNLLVNQADSTLGAYDFDESVLTMYRDRKNHTTRWLALEAWILSHCHAARRSAEWEAFLDVHAARIDKRDLPMARQIDERIHAAKSPAVRQYYADVDPYSGVNSPGVHLLGFRSAGGQRVRLSDH